MTEVKFDDFALEAAIDTLKHVSPQEREAAVQALEEDHPGIGNRVRALLALEKQTAEAIRKLEEKPTIELPKASVVPLRQKERWQKVGNAWFKDEGKGWRRHLGPLPKGN